MFCPVCGKEVKDGAQFCAFCGNRIMAAEVQPAVKKKSKKAVFILIPAAFLVLVAAVTLGWFVFFRGKGSVKYVPQSEVQISTGSTSVYEYDPEDMTLTLERKQSTGEEFTSTATYDPDEDQVMFKNSEKNEKYYLDIERDGETIEVSGESVPGESTLVFRQDGQLLSLTSTDETGEDVLVIEAEYNEEGQLEEWVMDILSADIQIKNSNYKYDEEGTLLSYKNVVSYGDSYGGVNDDKKTIKFTYEYDDDGNVVEAKTKDSTTEYSDYSQVTEEDYVIYLILKEILG